MFVDNFLASPGHGYGGGITSVVGQRHWDAGLRRPYLDKYDRACVTVNTGRTTLVKGVQTPIRERRLLRDLIVQGLVPPVFNATALRKEEWIMLDTQVLKAARLRLRVWSDIMQNSPFGGFNGMSKMILEHETMSDPGEAVVDMDAMTEGRTDQPNFQLQGLPLPITHCDFWYPQRLLSISRNSNTPLDVTMGEAAARRVAESVEKVTLGVDTGLTYGGNSTQVGGYSRNSSVYGLTNFPNRVIKNNMTVPTGSNPDSTVSDVLACLELLRNNKFLGPFMIYNSTDWDKWLDNDYARLGGSNANMTLRDRLRKIDGITDVRRADFLQDSATRFATTAEKITAANPYTFLFVQMTPDVIRGVNGMDISVVQWESMGGMKLNFKVMCIQVPQIRADYYGNCGILQATTS